MKVRLGRPAAGRFELDNVVRSGQGLKHGGGYESMLMNRPVMITLRVLYRDRFDSPEKGWSYYPTNGILYRERGAGI